MGSRGATPKLLALVLLALFSNWAVRWCWEDDGADSDVVWTGMPRATFKAGPEPELAVPMEACSCPAGGGTVDRDPDKSCGLAVFQRSAGLNSDSVGAFATGSGPPSGVWNRWKNLELSSVLWPRPVFVLADAPAVAGVPAAAAPPAAVLRRPFGPS